MNIIITLQYRYPDFPTSFLIPGHRLTQKTFTFILKSNFYFLCVADSPFVALVESTQARCWELEAWEREGEGQGEESEMRRDFGCGAFLGRVPCTHEREWTSCHCFLFSLWFMHLLGFFIGFCRSGVFLGLGWE